VTPVASPAQCTKMKKTFTRSIGAFALCGAIGFSAGGALGGLTVEGPIVFVFPIMAAIGGASLGLLLDQRMRAIRMALAGAVGFGIGSLPVLLFAGLGLGSTEPGQVIPLWGIIAGIVLLFALGVVQGLIGGAALGFGFHNRTMTGYLVAGGAAGFGIAAQGAWGFLLGLPVVVVYGLWGLIGGGSIGAALGYFEKRKESGRTG
jgi:hypothetical protein